MLAQVSTAASAVERRVAGLESRIELAQGLLERAQTAARSASMHETSSAPLTNLYLHQGGSDPDAEQFSSVGAAAFAHDADAEEEEEATSLGSGDFGIPTQGPGRVIPRRKSIHGSGCAHVEDMSDPVYMIPSRAGA